MYQTAGINPVRLPWRSNADGDYFLACQSCEHFVVLDAAMHKVVLRLLHYDKRAGGHKGRCLREAVLQLGLQAGDRLEPSRHLPDVALFDSCSSFPMPVVFWRTSAETLTRHRNPLFAEHLGITPERCLTVDALHCLYLGVMLVFCRHVIWLMITSYVWGRSGTMEETIETAVLVCRHELRGFYKQYREQHHEKPLTMVTNFTKKMIGDHSDQKLKTKAAQTWGVLLFLVDRLQRHPEQLGESGRSLLKAGQCLVQIVGIWDVGGQNLTPRQMQQCFDAWNQLLHLTGDIASMHIPKRHAFTHLLFKAIFLETQRGMPIGLMSH